MQSHPQLPGRSITDVSGEYALPDWGRWCLQCAGVIDVQQAGWELAPAHQRAMLAQRGYVAHTPAPAVRHLDGVVASLAAAEVHNLVQAYKPLQRYLVYDALHTKLVPLHVPPGDGCPVCSPEQGVLGLGDLEPLPDYRRTSPPQLPPPTARCDAPALPTDCGRRASHLNAERASIPVAASKAPALSAPPASTAPPEEPALVARESRTPSRETVGQVPLPAAADERLTPLPARAARTRRLQAALDEPDLSWL